MGEAPQAMVLVESVQDVDRLQIPADAKVAYLTQTTLSVDDANRIIERLRAKYPQLVNPPKDDICYATQNRQEAVRTLATEADNCLVLGRCRPLWPKYTWRPSNTRAMVTPFS